MNKSGYSYSIIENNDWENIPEKTRTLYVHRNACIESVLPPVPEGIVNLYCGGIGLEKVISLPSTLKVLGCYNNSLKSLPKLPNNLSILSCQHNPLVSLPEIPASVRVITCWFCGLTSLPDLYHTGIHTLNCSNNNCLTVLPKFEYDNIDEFKYYGNPLIPIYYRDRKKNDKIAYVIGGKKSIKNKWEIYHELNDLARIIVLKKMLTLLNRVYLDNKIRILQRAWKDYWYKPITLDGYDYPVSRYMIYNRDKLVCDKVYSPVKTLPLKCDA